MNHKIGRNDPCPCGSGRKYKVCCGKPAAPAPATSHKGAIGRALAWLSQHHRKAFAAALQEAIDDAAFEAFDDEDEARAAMDDIDAELWEQIQLNLTEWLMAEGDILVKGEHARVSELLLGPRGPLLSVGQRAWLEQLAARPLRVYDVTEVVPGVGLTLCDALDTDLPPFRVVERAGSESLRVGMKLGGRVMEVEGQHQLSGAVYPFPAWAGHALLEQLRAALGDADTSEEDESLMVGLKIIDSWLAQHLVPPAPPQILHSATGEPLLFITDHYEVQDWDALGTALAAQPDVRGDRDAGWDRLIDGADGQTRPHATVAPEPGGRRVSVLYKTAGVAGQGRTWFDALAGGSVKFLLQEVSDPKALWSRPESLVPPPLAAPSGGLDADAMAGAFESVVGRIYSNWADEPIPVLNGQTPRQAMQSPAGLERVKGLLRNYEEGEAEQAALQGRREVSYQFLWDALGLAE